VILPPHFELRDDANFSYVAAWEYQEDGWAASRKLFGSCANIGECEAVCPKLIKLEVSRA